MPENFRYPNLIAHRGAGKEAPENTLAAFRLGAKNGYTMFECDVKLSKDKELFLHHDDHLARTTNSEGLANLYTWNELSKIDAGGWHSMHYTGEPLARLAQLVDFVLMNKFQLDIELKPNDGEAYETGVEVANYLENRLEFNADKYPFLLSSFQPEALKGAMDTAPHIPRALLVDDWENDIEKFFDTLSELKCVGIITNYRILSAEIVHRCHSLGVFVMVYTANEPEDIKYLFSIGVDSVITDNMRFLKDSMS